jgi:hypothetical protein
MTRTRYRRDWTVQITLNETEIMNYWSKVAVAGPNDCWLWTGATTKNGYGAFNAGRQQRVATHVALVLSGKPRPAAPEDVALHGDCSNPRCVNPNHLRWGTHKENAEDKYRLRRQNVPRGEQSGMAKLTDDQVRYIRSSERTGVELSKELGISRAMVSLIRNRIRWAHVP